MMGLDVDSIFSGRKNTVQQIQGYTMREPRLEDMFHVSDTTQEGGDYILLRVIRLKSSGEILGAN